MSERYSELWHKSSSHDNVNIHEEVKWHQLSYLLFNQETFLEIRASRTSKFRTRFSSNGAAGYPVGVDGDVVRSSASAQTSWHPSGMGSRNIKFFGIADGRGTCAQ